MKMKLFVCLFIFLLIFLTDKAQVTENFTDGNFSVNPLWTGNADDWIVNPLFQLQSNNIVAGSSFYLSTRSTLGLSAQWELYTAVNFNTSAANYADIFLTASASDLKAVTTTGYFVRIGNTDDEISLYRKDATGIITKIIDGVNGVTAFSTNALKIKVTRDEAGRWTLYRDVTGSGNAWFIEGMVTDTIFNTAAFFGILVKQSTAGFFKRHFFDDIEIKPFTPDTIPPSIQAATTVSENTVEILFNEPVDIATSRVPENYIADHSLGNPATVVLDSTNPALVHLTFAGNFTSGANNQLTINGVKDVAGNSIVDGTVVFTYIKPYTPHLYDIVIDEIMADPSPKVGLPENEWIELKNTSGFAIQLKDWKIGDASGQSGPMPGFILLPDSFVIVCSNNAAVAMAAFGATIAVTGFPSLDNMSGQLFLISPQNSIIHSVNYKDSWYHSELKKAGGWTLEMIDTKNPCSGSNNWKGSTDTRGGSPGKKNAVDALNPDTDPPKLLRAYALDSINIVLVFNEPLDSGKAATAANYTVSDGIGPATSAVLIPSLPDRVNVRLSTPLIHNKIYQVSAMGVTDCLGNAIGAANSARVGLTEIAAASDIVINEILFNPPPSGTDYVEIYNRSNKIIDLKQSYIASRNSSGALTSIARLSAESNLLFPQDFIVITENAGAVRSAYLTANRDAFAEIPTMPAFNNDKGIVVILNAQGDITDELSYNENWHFKLIDNHEGVALERIDYNALTQLADNWHSAATSVGYGTPTYKNSQYRINDGVQGELKLSPEIVSPDNDGQDDFATIDYHFPDPGYIANITIFDASGKPARYLERNALCGTAGSFRWDGLGEKSLQLATGVYVVFTEIFNLKGRKKQFKNAIVVARRR